MALRKGIRERLVEAKAKLTAETKVLDLLGLAERLLGGKPNPTQWAFICDPAPDKAYMGAAGVAKTSTICCAGLMRALLQPGSKGVIARRDYNDLKDTTMLRMEEMINRLPPGVLIDRSKDPPAKWYLRCADGENVSQLTFMGLSDAIVGFEANWAIVDEANEPEEARIAELAGRMRAPGGEHCTMLAFNPPDKKHWLYRACTGLDERDRHVAKPIYKLFTPLPKENNANLPPGYHDSMAAKMPEDLRARYIRGEWGVVFEGKPVYREFSPKIHCVSGLGVRFDPWRPLLRFWDFGYRHPAALLAQVDDEGRLLIFQEIIGEDEEILPFARKVQAQTRGFFPLAQKIIDFGDPAVRQKKDTGQTLAILGTINITMLFTFSKIEDGVRKIRLLLERVVRSEAAFQIDTEKCGMLVRAMRGGYRLDASGQKPVKDGMYDHVADALRYGVYNLYDIDGSVMPEVASDNNEFAPAMHNFSELPDSWAPEGDQ